jgi:TfoX/Sxy family transcriptional regulator of competence genes
VSCYSVLEIKIPRPDEKSKEFFESLVPEDPRVRVRPMFGNISGFVNGNMFMGLYGSDIFVRLSENNQAELKKIKGASNFEPMKGRVMKDYVVLPKSWLTANDREKILPWVSRSLNDIAKLPEKTKGKKSKALAKKK